MELKKELNLLDIFSITTGTMMSAGIFILPGLAHAQAGSAIIVSYLLAGLLTIPGLLSQAELSTAMPKAGGSYYFITRSLGSAVGTIYGLITWFALTLKSAFALVGMTVFLSLIINFNELAIAASLCILFIGINIIGIKVAGRIQVVFVISIIVTLIVYIILGIPAVRIENIVPFAPNGTEAILSTAGYVFISYGGLLKVASVAEEVKDPGKVLPLGMILSLIIVLIIYLLVIFVTTGTVESSVLNNSLTPISDGAAIFIGNWGKILLSIIAILAFTSASNAGIMAASRYPMALGRDNLLPEIFGKISSRFKTPFISIIITGFFIILTLLFKLDVLIKAASSVVILTFLFSCISIIILRESRLQNYQPSFKSPLYPWIQLIGIIGTGYLLIEIGREAIFTSSILILSGLFIYLIYGRKRAEQEYALMHLIERITSKDFTTHSLETELKEVIRERDDIVRDRFDKIIEKSIIFDIEESMPVETFFEKVADSLAVNLKINPKKLLKLLRAREKESSTVLSPGLAIPHIVIDGEKSFDILVARSKGGINFSKKSPSVHSIFVLIGTRDERNFHLRALSAIAQIVQDPKFEEKWIAAKNIEGIRDIILLGKRRR